MIRFIFRFVALLIFALACVFAVVDSARSVGASQFIFTPLSQTLAFISPDLPGLWGDMFNNIHPMLNDPVLVTVLKLPTWLIAGTIAAFFYAIGHRPRRRRGRFIVS